MDEETLEAAAARYIIARAPPASLQQALQRLDLIRRHPDVIGEISRFFLPPRVTGRLDVEGLSTQLAGRLGLLIADFQGQEHFNES